MWHNKPLDSNFNKELDHTISESVMLIWILQWVNSDLTIPTNHLGHVLKSPLKDWRRGNQIRNPCIGSQAHTLLDH